MVGLPGSLANTPTLSERDIRQNRISIDVLVDAGVPVTVPRSLTHQIKVEELERDNDPEQETSDIGVRRFHASLIAPDISDRDFELLWAPMAGATPAAAVQFEQFEQDWYGLLVVAPPDPNLAPVSAQPREVIFVIDTSGSMHGDSITQARDALRFGLQRLASKDRFNIIQFNSRYELLFRRSRPANEANLNLAHAIYRQLAG